MNEFIDEKHYVPLGAVRSVERSAQSVLLNVGEERFRVDVLARDLFRLKISQGRVFDEEPTFAVVETPTLPVSFDVKQDDLTITVQTDALRLVVRRDPFSLSAYRTDGSVLFEDVVDSRGEAKGYLSLNDSFIITRKLGRHDAIYGLGEKTGRFDRRGRKLVLWNTDVLTPGVLEANRLHEVPKLDGKDPSFDPYYASIPFFYLCRADAKKAHLAGFFIDNGFLGRFDFTSEETYRYQFEGGQYTEYLFSGPDMPGILRAYTQLTGRMRLPPLWALGTHQCRFHDYSQGDVLGIAEEYRERSIPIDVMWLDIGYMNGYRVFTWDNQKFPDVTGLVKQLGEMKFRLITIVDPGVKFEPGNPVFEEGHAKNYFCKTDSGKPFVGQVWPGRTVFPDFSRAEVRSWWGELNARHAQVGISGIWNDMNEPATGDVPPFAMRFDRDGENHPHERFHNQYGLLMAMGTYEGLRALRPTERPFILSRAGFAGIQRYAAQWTGDNYSEWSHLSMSIAMSAGMGVSGQAFVGSDVPGFMGRATSELAVRWVQYGALTPFCRYHNAWGERDQYPWSFGPGVELLSRKALEMRYRLLPYLYSAFVEAAETGAPVLRPLVYHFPHDRQARETDDSYLLGSSLLVAPITEEGRTTRNVYLPDGSWCDFHTGVSYEGARFVTVPAPLEYTPIFVRGGQVIPMYSEAPTSTLGFQSKSLDLLVAIPGAEGDYESFLQEDDGSSTHYEQNAYLRTEFRLERRGKTLRLTSEVSGRGFKEFARSNLRFSFLGSEVASVHREGRPIPLDEGSYHIENRGEPLSLTIQLV